MKRGPKPRQITDQLLEQVEQLAARGLSQKQVCDALSFSQSWWHSKKAESQELGGCYKKGAAKGIADVSNAIYEQALAGSTGAACFFLKNRDPDRWPDVKSVNAVQINLSRMTDSQLVNELRSEPSLLSAIIREIPELNQLPQIEEEESIPE